VWLRLGTRVRVTLRIKLWVKVPKFGKISESLPDAGDCFRHWGSAVKAAALEKRRVSQRDASYDLQQWPRVQKARPWIHHGIQC
jgi:hypothetical protein